MMRFPKIPGRDLRLILIFIGLVFVPILVLGYFSWHAIQNEKQLSAEKLSQSYRQFAKLAGKEIDAELTQVAEKWTAAVDTLLRPSHPTLRAGDVASLERRVPLISTAFLLAAPGNVIYPKGIDITSPLAGPRPFRNSSYVLEYSIFEQLKNEGEELEYHAYRLDQALVKYEKIQARVTNPQLLAMAQSYIGRVLKKQGDWREALSVFQKLLRDYPEMRDNNNMYLRFLAQYQMAVCLESLSQDEKAAQQLLQLNRDLLARSDAINATQYSFFLENLQNLANRLLVSPDVPVTVAQQYQQQFVALGEQGKKRLSQKYFLQLLEGKLGKMVLARKFNKPKFYYVSDRTDKAPYLLVYRPLPDRQGIYTEGMLGLQIDLERLGDRLFPRILDQLKFSDQVDLAILDERNQYLFGTATNMEEPIAKQNIAPPFDFWQIAISLNDKEANLQLGAGAAWRAWLTVALLGSILIGVFVFVRKARRESRLSMMKSDFVSSVSHELRTPLTSISMLAELLEMQLSDKPTLDLGKESGKSHQYLRIIRRECNRLNRLIQNVLDFSRMEKGLNEYRFEALELGEVLHGAVETSLPYIQGQGFELTTDIPPELPLVLVDSDAISQLLLNLFSNAIKYSEDSKEILIRARSMEKEVAIDVIDHGIGLAASEIPKIFGEFYRVDQRLNARKQGGLGLGLTLVRDIVAAHKGDIQVESIPGDGSTFTILLPICSGTNGSACAESTKVSNPTEDTI